MKLKGKLLSQIPKKVRIFLPDDTVVECVSAHSFIFDSGLSKTTFNYKKGQRDRLGWVFIKDNKFWKVQKEGENKIHNN
jgi:hypothetical protein